MGSLALAFSRGGSDCFEPSRFLRLNVAESSDRERSNEEFGIYYASGIAGYSFKYSWKDVVVPLSHSRRFGRVETLPLYSLCGLLLLSVGCGEPDAAANAPPKGKSQPAATATLANAPPTPANEQRQLLRESWELVLVGGAKIGHSHFQEFTTNTGDQEVRELVSSNVMSMQRFGQTVEQSIEATSIETPDGQVLRFGTEMLTGESRLTIAGEYRDGKMLIETATLGKKQSSSLDWAPSWGGFFADQQSLKRKPMQPGEERTIVALIPSMAQAGAIKMTAMQRESVKLLSEERELLRIETLLEIAGTKIKSVLWADDKGEVFKMSVPGLNHESYRTTKEIALQPNGKAEFDLGAQTVVKVDTPIPSPHSTTRIVYRARLANGSPAETFANCRSQSVKKIDEHTAEITVVAIRPESANAELSDSGKPTDADVRPNNLIQSDDGAIVSLATRFAEGQSDPWALSRTFESDVRDFVHSKNFSQAIGSAADVVRSREGDCTEHSVLLAALCRAKGIPARVAIGLVYYGRAQGFAYHMWNEVWIADGWVPIDATLGLGGIGAAHLKIADSALSSASPVSALLPVVEVLGQLELEVLSVN